MSEPERWSRWSGIGTVEVGFFVEFEEGLDDGHIPGCNAICKISLPQILIDY